MCVYECIRMCDYFKGCAYVYLGVPVHKLIHIVHAEQAMCQTLSETDALPFALLFSFPSFDTQSLHRYVLSMVKICMMKVL